MTHHTSDAVCPSCAEKLLQAHPYLQSWFKEVKSRYANAHVSWSFRDMTDQNEYLREGKTRLAFPKSAHNVSVQGKPCSMALDLFLIDEDGIAKWPPLWFAKLNSENQTMKEPIFWGGKWKSLGDGDHYQYTPDSIPLSAA